MVYIQTDSESSRTADLTKKMFYLAWPGSKRVNYDLHAQDFFFFLPWQAVSQFMTEENGVWETFFSGLKGKEEKTSISRPQWLLLPQKRPAGIWLHTSIVRASFLRVLKAILKFILCGRSRQSKGFLDPRPKAFLTASLAEPRTELTKSSIMLLSVRPMAQLFYSETTSQRCARFEITFPCWYCGPRGKKLSHIEGDNLLDVEPFEVT